jgi:ribonuclease III
MARQDDRGDQAAGMAALVERLAIRSSDNLSQALTHPSFANERPEAGDNQRLEFLGDAVLGLCVSEMLMAAFQDVDEGSLTVMRASLVNARALAEAARELEFAAALRLGRGADGAGERHRLNVLADAVEAVLGAVYLDDGLDAARGVARKIVGTRLDTLVQDGGIERDPKSRLQERVQAIGLSTPSYDVVAVDGPPHMREFRVRVTVPQNEHDVVAEGAGRSKKLAEKAAARAALAKISDD